MSERKTETISITGGITYAKVSARLLEFHADNEQCDIDTTYDFCDGYVVFSAKVTTKKGTFSGHSMGKMPGKQKQFEKQETISVGRALAFGGYLADGAIACAEEMADIITTTQLNFVKIKYATVFADELTDMDRTQKQQKFNSWCLSIIGEQADYSDSASWSADWLKTCQRELTGGIDSDIPFPA